MDKKTEENNKEIIGINDKKYFENNEEEKTKVGLDDFIKNRDGILNINEQKEKNEWDEEREEKIKKIRKEQKLSFMKDFNEWFVCIIIAIILAFLIKFFLGTFTTVKQSSMYPTFRDGNKLWLNRLSRTLDLEYKRGDIVTFESPYNKNININNMHPKANFLNIEGKLNKFNYYFIEKDKISLIKRIIGLPGEKVTITNGEIYINDELLEEPYLDSSVKTVSKNLDNFIVPENHYFLLGDNRDKSMDSRMHGCIPKEKIEGKISMCLWPLSDFRIVDPKQKGEISE